MNPVPFPSGNHPSWIPMLPPDPPPSSAFWDTTNVVDRMRDLQDTLHLAKAMQRELEMLIMIKEGKGSKPDADKRSIDPSVSGFSKFLSDRRFNFESQELCSVEAANDLMSKLRVQLEPFRAIADEKSFWEEKSAAVRLANKIRKSKRNKCWRKKKRKEMFERIAKEREQFDQADQEADEWRAQEIAKDIAKRKMEKMKEIAKLKAKEERKALESELEMVLIVDKLQELRAIRIQKLKKQGHFLPEEDDKFLERVRAAVEEEELQAMAAADTDAAKDAIATAEESRRNLTRHEHDLEDANTSKLVEHNDGLDETTQTIPTEKENQQRAEGWGHGGAYDSVASLPIEFYHYYHGSNTDMGTLIEVRRAWDAFIRPGGSRIPGHWVQPPPPADEVWASYLVHPPQ